MSLNKGAKRNNTAGKAIKQPQERRTPQKQTKQTQIIDTTPSSRNPEDLVEEFTDMFPDYKSLTKEEIISIFREYNNDFQAVVNSVMDQTIGTKPTESRTDVPKKKKKKGQDQPRAPKTKSDDNRAENRAQNRNRNGRDNTRNPNRTRDQPAANQNARGQPNKNRPAQPASSVPPATAPVQAAPPSLQSTGGNAQAAPQAAPAPAPPSKEAFTSHTAPLTASAPEPFTHTPPSATPTTSTPTSSFARSTISYANAAKSRQPWSPHTQTAPQASSSPAQESESKKLVPEPEEPKPVVAEVPAQPVLAQPAKQPEPVVERPAPKAAPAKQPTPPREASKPAETQPAPVQPKPAPVEQKQRAGVVLPGSFVTEESMQFQFGNLGIYDEEPETSPEPIISAPVNVTKPASSNLSNPPAPPKTAPAPTPAAAAAASPVTAAQDYPEGISHVSNETENMIPHLPYAPNQFMPYPFDAESSRPVGHYYEAQGYPTAFPRDGKGYPGRQTGNNFGGRGDSKYTGQEPGATNTQATAQTPSAPSQGYPYHSMYPYGPFMGQFPSYSTSQFHYQPAPMGYYPAKRAYPNFGNYPSNTGMGYPDEEYKGATGYSSIPQQPGSYYMQPGEAANPSLNRDSKSQSTGQANTSKPGQSGNQQSSKPSSQSYSNAPSQDQGATNPSGAGVSNSFKASGNSNSDAYYPRDSQYGIGNTSFMSQGFYPHPQIVAQTQPNTTPYQPNRSNY